MRPLVVIALAAVASTAEVARRDLLLAVEVADGAFAYELGTGIGTLDGEDAFDRLGLLRLGGRWAFAAPGARLAPLLGLDAELLDAPMPGGGLDGQGLAAAAGGTWAIAEPLALDLEGFAGWQRCSFTLAEAGLDGDGELQRYGLRARLSWHLTRHWSLAVEGSWSSWNADFADGDGLTLDGDGLGAGLALAWRPSARPGSIE